MFPKLHDVFLCEQNWWCQSEFVPTVTPSSFPASAWDIGDRITEPSVSLTQSTLCHRWNQVPSMWLLLHMKYRAIRLRVLQHRHTCDISLMADPSWPRWYYLLPHLSHD
ncbi:hypothetical protein VFPPC_16637 [Pochonia chlamydosporia 170]|uniref:Uncharacterized protein n=1 Tax=Pochonia chlamydosporia 170 TaxID=1380566 RepID=A0A179FAF5_METCM|nr:hypothetical protein VFPPC_16637 [Pochonia chlamydosporia 170]OAQ62290.1 hypothetical protein VFPPC_16637 [Pochonia chlamydosporia 170]